MHNINEKMKKNLIFAILILIIVITIFIYQTQKVGFHEDEVYSLSSAVNPKNGLMLAYRENFIPEDEAPNWKTKEYVSNYMTLTPDNYLNLKSIYTNQAMDNHPPLFYTLVHFASLLFGGQFSKYTIFTVNIIAFIMSCIVIKKILELLNKRNIVVPTIMFYGLSMGTISMVLYQRMYMLLTLFILLYFYSSLQIYFNDFVIDKKTQIKLGIITVLGFLTQYYFAIYALLIFTIMLVKMIKDKNYKNLKKYIIIHIIYAIIGILAFVPCIWHLLFTDRGVTNLNNSNYLEHFLVYLKYLAYAFTLKDNLTIIILALIFFALGLSYLCKKTNRKFVVALITIPNIIFFLITVKLTSFQELRYIMPIIPFVAISLFMVLEKIISKDKYKTIILTTISILLIIPGIIYSKPKFLYLKYTEYLKLAKENSEKPFVYVYDNFFNHMQSIPEMMIYKKTLIINNSKDELKYLFEDEELEKEQSYILSIKSYMNCEEILKEIKENTEFKNVKLLCNDNSNQIGNNLYLLSKI